MNVEEGARQVPLRRSAVGKGKEREGSRRTLGGAGRGGSGGRVGGGMMLWISLDVLETKRELNLKTTQSWATLAPECACLKVTHGHVPRRHSFNCFC